MIADQILDAIHAKYPTAALVKEVVIGDRRGNRRRIDALMFQTLQRTAIEVKVSVPDFHRDTLEKRDPWMRVTHRFIYAVPAGLVDEAPEGCGLWWVESDGGITIKKRATLREPEPLPERTVQALAYRAMKADGLQPVRRRRKKRRRRK